MVDRRATRMHTFRLQMLAQPVAQTADVINREWMNSLTMFRMGLSEC